VIVCVFSFFFFRFLLFGFPFFFSRNYRLNAPLNFGPEGLGQERAKPIVLAKPPRRAAGFFLFVFFFFGFFAFVCSCFQDARRVLCIVLRMAAGLLVTVRSLWSDSVPAT